MPIFNQGTGGGGASLSPIIVVSAPTGSTVTCKKGSTVLTAEESSGTWSFAIPAYGTWTVTGVNTGTTVEKTVEVTAIEVYFVTLEFIPAVLNNATWAQVKQASDSGVASNYWAVGDTKQITMNGKVSDGLTLSNYSTYVYIIGFNHNSSVEGTGIAFGGFKTAASGGIDVALCDSGYNSNKTSGQWFNMNNSNTNSGGWKNSAMRTTHLPAILALMPTEVQNGIREVSKKASVGGESSTIETVSDKLFLLSEIEIFGSVTYSMSGEGSQYAYYKAGNSRVKSNNGTETEWWERSRSSRDVASFCCVSEEGSAQYTIQSVYYESTAFAFCF